MYIQSFIKQALFVFFMLCCSTLFAQTQKIHTLQVTDGTATESMSTDALIQLDSKNKGMLLPRVALTDAKLSAPLAIHTAGMTVYNTATVSSTATVEGVTPGYYYNNGTKWVRLTDTDDQEWVYDSTSKQINLKRSGTAPFVNKVGFDGKGLLKNYTDETYEYWDRFTKTYKISSSAAKVSSNYLQRNSQSLAPILNSAVKSKYLTNSLLIADETTSDAWSLYNGVSSVMIKKDNVANYRNLTAFGMGANHQGKGHVKYLTGSSSWASLFNGAKSSGYLVGVRSAVNLFDNSTANEMSGIRTYNVDWGNGTINSLEGAHHFLSFEQNSSSTIDNILGVTVHPITHSNSGSQITNVKAFYYKTKDWKAEPNTVTVQNEYGVYVDDVAKGVKNNYAIYTNKGLSSFGDDVQIRNINTQVSTSSEHKIVVADATGKLRVSDASINPNPASEAWVLKGNGGTNPATNFIGTTDNQALNIRTNNTNKITVLPNGNVGIGTTTPKNELDVAGAIRAINPKSGTATTGSDGLYYTVSSDEQPHYDTETGIISTALTEEEAKRSSIFLQVADTEAGRDYGRIQLVSGFTEISKKLIVGKSGNISAKLPEESLYVYGAAKFLGNVEASGTITPSDKRFKEGIGTLNIGLASLSKLRPVSYHWNAKGKEQGGDTKEHLGFIAQEIEKVLPNLVSTDKEGYKSVNYIEMIPVLTKAIQEQQKEIEELKALVKQLLTDKK